MADGLGKKLISNSHIFLVPSLFALTALVGLVLFPQTPPSHIPKSSGENLPIRLPSDPVVAPVSDIPA